MSSVETRTAQWMSEDKESLRKLYRSLRKMEVMAQLNECVGDMAQRILSEHAAVLNEAKRRGEERRKWHVEEVGTARLSADVPSLDSFLSKCKTGKGCTLAEKPKWFDVACISATATEMAWTSAVKGECDADVSSKGGDAVKRLYDMMIAAQAHASGDSEMDWNSHSVDKEAAKKVVLDMFENVGSANAKEEDFDSFNLFYKHESNIQEYKKAMQEFACKDKDKVAIEAPMQDLSIDDKKGAVMAPTHPPPSLPGAKAVPSSGWWSGSSWMSGS